jgi:hypothetical protein
MYNGKRRRTCIAASVELHANRTRLVQVCRRMFELVRGKGNLSPGKQYKEQVRDRDSSRTQAASFGCFHAADFPGRIGGPVQRKRRQLLHAGL